MSLHAGTGGFIMAISSPPEAAKICCNVAFSKAHEPLITTLVLGFVAGAYIAFGGAIMTFVTHDAAAHVGLGIAKLLGGVVFALALFLIVVAGGELFTGNCLMAIGTLSGCAAPSKVLKNWVVVYFANMAGAAVVTLMLWKSGVFSDVINGYALRIAAGKVDLTFTQMLLRGILCNWLVAIAVWVTYAAHDVAGKYVGCLVPVSAFVALGFEHSVANMYFIFFGLLLKTDPAAVQASGLSEAAIAKLTTAGYVGNMIPVTIGNIIGGAFFVATLYFAVFRKELN